MNRDARECLDSAAERLSKITGCELREAVEVVELIALAALRWKEEESKGPRFKRVATS